VQPFNDSQRHRMFNTSHKVQRTGGEQVRQRAPPGRRPLVCAASQDSGSESSRTRFNNGTLPGQFGELAESNRHGGSYACLTTPARPASFPLTDP
jgi:hypothetical protein